MKSKVGFDMKKLIISFAIAFIGCIGLFAVKTYAGELDIDISASDGSNGGYLKDDTISTTEHFDGGATITISTAEPMDSVYIKWDIAPGVWQLDAGGTKINCGANNYLHEYVKLPQKTTSVTMTMPSNGVEIADIYAFSEGELPDFVQQWQPSWDKADVLVLSAHADDDVLFFGPLIEIYGAEKQARVQVVYFTNMAYTENYRCHELLEGLWAMGIRNYPYTMSIQDAYSETIDGAIANLNMSEEQALGEVVGVIRRFKPQVLVLHDVNGEYGHGQHMLSCEFGKRALDICPDASQYADSASQYGVWNVPKCYIHLYGEKQIKLDTRSPLSAFGGMSALDVAKAAYLKHESQQYAWFYVDDTYEYSCADFGLFRSLVGDDTGNDILENIIPYDKQIVEPETTAPEKPAPKEPEKKSNSLVIILIIIAVIIVIVVVLFIIYKKNVNKKKRRKKQQNTRRRYR